MSNNPRIAFNSGYLAAKNGYVKVGDNPYSEHDHAHWHWLNGYTTYCFEQMGAR